MVSPCSPAPEVSLGTRSTACGRQALSLGNAWWRSSDQRAVLLHPPALLNSRSGQAMRRRQTACRSWS
eukprot:4781056-Prymnesium_polylepis.1